MKLNRPKVSKTRSGSFQVYFRTLGQSIRKRFATRAEAELVAQQLLMEAVSDQPLRTRLVQTWLSDEQVRWAEDYWDRQPKAQKAKSIEALYDEYLLDAERRGLRPRTLKNVAEVLGRADLRKPLLFLADKTVSPVTTQTRYRYLHAFYQWAAKHGGPPNPLSGFTPPRVSARLPAVLTPDQARTLIAEARKHRFQWFFALTLFSGLRPEEALQFDDAWVGADRIQIPPTFSKVHQVRTMPLHENLALILKEDRAPWNKTRAGKIRGCVPWQQDIGRHSYASYRLVLDGDLERLALTMGNSPAVLRRHYLRQTVTKAEAEDYFSIR